MTDHTNFEMHKEARRITDKEMISAILKHCHVATVVMHDEPYPYAVSMNYGFCWEEKPIFYFHMAQTGLKLSLLQKNPKVMLSIHDWLDRAGYQPYRKENHDYRSVNVFGTARIITPEDEETFLKGMSVLQQNNYRPPVKQLTTRMRDRLFVLEVTGEIITAKSQYPISTLEEVPMPENVPNTPK
ncbi:MAG: hypothetical protein HFH53_00680 [Hespellia sp.]|nr:hypothetical protein [Hespellia sp.]